MPLDRVFGGTRAAAGPSVGRRTRLRGRFVRSGARLSRPFTAARPFRGGRVLAPVRLWQRVRQQRSRWNGLVSGIPDSACCVTGVNPLQNQGHQLGRMR